MPAGGRRLVEVLAGAFADDPWLHWTLPDVGAVRSLMSVFLRTAAFPYGEVLVAGDPVVGAVVLMGPEVVPPEAPEVGSVVLALHGHRAGLALDADSVVSRYRPVEPAWVLHTIGVAPAAQGQGIGGRLLEAAIDLAGDWPLQLETSSPVARDWYLRRGFTLDAEVELGVGHGLPPNAPTVWLLSHHP
ncbi:GNAT family N-acetyltransferase [soil metagenome]